MREAEWRPEVTGRRKPRLAVAHGEGWQSKCKGDLNVQRKYN